MTIREITMHGRTYKVLVQHSQYSNGRTALILRLTEPENVGEVLTKATVNLPEEPCPEGEVWVKSYAENEGMREWLIAQGLIEAESEAVSCLPFGNIVSRHKLIPQKKGPMDSCNGWKQMARH